MTELLWQHIMRSDWVADWRPDSLSIYEQLSAVLSTSTGSSIYWGTCTITALESFFSWKSKTTLSVCICEQESVTTGHHMGRVKRICVFEHSVMTNFNCACTAIQRGQGSGFLSEGSSWLTACMSEQRRFWRDCADAQARLNLRCSHRR